MTDTTYWERELRHSWPLLQPRSPTEVATAPLQLPCGSDRARVGVDGTGARHLLVPVGDDDVSDDNAEGALSVRLRTYSFSRTPLRYVDVSCVRPDLFDLFDEILVDVLDTAATAPDTAARTAVDVVGRWRALLDTRRARALTLVGQMSLFAELTVLDVLTRDRTLQVGWWRGPLREPHDIVLPERAVEVKAVGATTTAVEIHGVLQMEPPGLPLALVLTTVSESDSGTTLPGLVEHVLGRVDDRGEAIRLLAAAGYSRSDAERYTERFTVEDIGLVEVTAAVPRIVPASFANAGLPAGIDGVTYRIALDTLDPLIARGEAALLAWAGGKR